MGRRHRRRCPLVTSGAYTTTVAADEEQFIDRALTRFLSTTEVRHNTTWRPAQ
ncbi:hypothetical protein [Nocardia xishanensis]|uniref:hypothetical protein n=1 Tax=Nocardia xishanensis TaxID=238964 RepID=UPI000A66A5E4|nr:hypothetical protein [Nocardia xishanensis]